MQLIDNGSQIELLDYTSKLYEYCDLCVKKTVYCGEPAIELQDKHGDIVWQGPVSAITTPAGMTTGADVEVYLQGLCDGPIEPPVECFEWDTEIYGGGKITVASLIAAGTAAGNSLPTLGAFTGIKCITVGAEPKGTKLGADTAASSYIDYVNNGGTGSITNGEQRQFEELGGDFCLTPDATTITSLKITFT